MDKPSLRIDVIFNSVIYRIIQFIKYPLILINKEQYNESKKHIYFLYADLLAYILLIPFLINYFVKFIPIYRNLNISDMIDWCSFTIFLLICIITYSLIFTATLNIFILSFKLKEKEESCLDFVKKYKTCQLVFYHAIKSSIIFHCVASIMLIMCICNVIMTGNPYTFFTTCGSYIGALTALAAFYLFVRLMINPISIYLRTKIKLKPITAFFMVIVINVITCEIVKYLPTYPPIFNEENIKQAMHISKSKFLW